MTAFCLIRRDKSDIFGGVHIMSKYLVVGAGLFGAVFANEAAKRGHEVTVIEKRDHLAGNIY
ncbi:NAD(P)-binding protein, partial [Campylobacter coli]|uniref:NAD(P)-binding protein n=1 Tax=Campylobacter coli TaxID=195 RepID=UPI0034E054E8